MGLEVIIPLGILGRIFNICGPNPGRNGMVPPKWPWQPAYSQSSCPRKSVLDQHLVQFIFPGTILKPLYSGYPELGVVREVQSSYPRLSERFLRRNARVRKKTGTEHTRSRLMWREILPDRCHLSTQGALFSALKVNSLRERHSLKNLLNTME